MTELMTKIEEWILALVARGIQAAMPQIVDGVREQLEKSRLAQIKDEVKQAVYKLDLENEIDAVLNNRHFVSEEEVQDQIRMFIKEQVSVYIEV